MEGIRQLCTFFVEDLFFGIDIADVREVLFHQQMARVPLAPPVVEGLINLRGQIVTAVDLRRRLGIAARPVRDEPMNVVVFTPGGLVSLLVDKVGDVVTVDQSMFETVPETIKPSMRQLLSGVYKLDKKLLLVVEPVRAVEIETTPK